MRYLLVVVVSCLLLVGCDEPKPSPSLVSHQSMGKVQSMYCYEGDMELKTDTGFDATAITTHLKCPVVQLNTEAFIDRYSDGSCKIVWNDNAYRCY